jgi:hypothetical protein
MLAIDAVLVVQLSASLMLGVFAVAIADIPSTRAPRKFAHVGLGLAGVLKAEARPAPSSFIRHADCHLTGGCALFYWFAALHADSPLVGRHPAIAMPAGYPNPSRLGISWSLNAQLSITGEAYFAVTPKTCMGLGRLRGLFTVGPVRMWFNALVDFLVSYQPLHFMARAHISVGVGFQLSIDIIKKLLSAEVGTDLELWGPPLAGRMHVDFWLHSF